MVITPGTMIFDGDKEEYEVLEDIGAGGCGVVYKLFKRKTGENFALKTLSPAFSNEQLLAGLSHDAEAALQVSHPNVLKYFYFHDGNLFTDLPPYIIMEFADGGTLSDYISKSAELFTEQDLKEIFSFLIEGMRAINEKVIHRDIKPENILFKEDVLKIADFGLSKLIDERTRSNTFKDWGTSEYTAPEVWQGKNNTIQVDIYSMGIVFYKLTTLKHPFEHIKPLSHSDWENAHMFELPNRIDSYRSDLSSKFTQVLLKMIEKEVSSRYKNWDDIENDLHVLHESDKQDDLVTRIIGKRIEKD